MRKQIGSVSVRSMPKGAQRYLEPIGGYTDKALAGMLSSGEISSLMCADGRVRNFRPATEDEVTSVEESRKTDDHFHFALWYMDPKTGKATLWKSDLSYTQRNPSLFYNRQRWLRNGLKTGSGRPARIPHRRRLPGSFMQGMRQ